MAWQAENLESLLDSKISSTKAVTQLHCADRERKTAPSKVFQGTGHRKSDQGEQTHLRFMPPDER